MVPGVSLPDSQDRTFLEFFPRVRPRAGIFVLHTYCFVMHGFQAKGKNHVLWQDGINRIQIERFDHPYG